MLIIKNVRISQGLNELIKRQHALQQLPFPAISGDSQLQESQTTSVLCKMQISIVVPALSAPHLDSSVCFNIVYLL